MFLILKTTEGLDPLLNNVLVVCWLQNLILVMIFLLVINPVIKRSGNDLQLCSVFEIISYINIPLPLLNLYSGKDSKVIIMVTNSIILINPTEKDKSQFIDIFKISIIFYII
jgi:hypothetical protein